MNEENITTFAYFLHEKLYQKRSYKKYAEIKNIQIDLKRSTITNIKSIYKRMDLPSLKQLVSDAVECINKSVNYKVFITDHGYSENEDCFGFRVELL